MLALAVLSCMLLVGAPACSHRKDRSKSPPHTKEQKKAVKKPKKANTPVKKTAQSKRVAIHKN